MKNYLLYIVCAGCIGFSACSNDDDTNGNDPNNNANGICGGFFEANAMTTQFTAGPCSDYYATEFDQNQKYDVVIAKNGDVTVEGNTETFAFTEAMITDCGESHETNVFYENPANDDKMILQKEGTSMQIILHGRGGQAQLDKLGPADLSLLQARAGTYTVTGMTGQAIHNRMTVIINSDGTIDFDDSIEFTQDEIDAVYDRLDCCDRIHVDLTTGTMNLYWKGTNLMELDYISYQGNTWEF